MARITQYQQGQLASPVVGTPETNNAISNTLGMIGQQAGQTGNQLVNINNSLFQSELQERRRKEAELRAYNKKLQDESRSAYVADKVSAADVEMTAASMRIRDDHHWDTKNALSSFSNSTQEIKSRMLEQEEDPLTKMELSKALAQRGTTYLDTLARWTEGRQVPIMDSNIQNAAGSFSLQLGNAALPAVEVGQKIQQFKNDLSSSYAFTYGPEGAKKLQDDTESGILNWLSATTLNSPDLLEARIQSVAGGKLIDPGKLLKFANEQRRIANEVKAQQHIQDAQDRMSAKLNAFDEALISGGTGDYKDASPQTIAEIQKKYGAKLSPEDNIRLQQIKLQSGEEGKQKALKAGALQSEQTVVAQFGNFSAEETKLAAEVESKIARLYDRKISPKQKLLNLADLQVSVSKYQDAYLNLNAIKNSITNKDLKGVANLNLIAAKERFGDIVNKVAGSKQGNDASLAKNTLYSALIPKNIYPDARRNGVYHYIYQNLFYEKLQQLGVDPEKITGMAKDPRAVKALQNYLHTNTYQRMRQMGITE